MFITWFILVRDSIEIEPVSDLPLLKAFHKFALKGAKLMGYDVLEVFVLGLEVPLAHVEPVKL